MANYNLLENVSFVTTGRSYRNTADSPLDTFNINASANGVINAVVVVEQSSDNFVSNVSPVKTWTISTPVYFSDMLAVDVPLNYYVRARVVSISGLNAKVSVSFSASVTNSVALINSNQTNAGSLTAAGVGTDTLYDQNGNPISAGGGSNIIVGSAAPNNGDGQPDGTIYIQVV